MSEKGQEEEDDDGEEEGEEDDYSDDSDGDQLESEDSVEELGGQADTRADEEERLNPEDGWKQLDLIRTSPPPFSRWEQCFIAFLAGFTITVLAFDGSTADAACAGAFAWLLTCLALFASGSNPLIAKVFELLAAFLISAFSPRISKRRRSRRSLLSIADAIQYSSDRWLVMKDMIRRMGRGSHHGC